jgi:proline iminopeptidase
MAFGCTKAQAPAPGQTPARASAPNNYFDTSGRNDVLSGGARLIPITTPKGTFKVWTKRVGNNPRIKVLLLHGGPGVTHEVYEAFDSYFPGAGIEYYYYDQLGSFFSISRTCRTCGNCPVHRTSRCRRS